MNRPRRPSGSPRPDSNGSSERTALYERVAKLETHQEYSATREDLSKSISEVEKRLSELTAAITNININMATKTWVLGGVLALLISLAASALNAYIRAMF